MTERLSEEDFNNAVFVRAEEPEGNGGITIARTEFGLCALEPLRLMVLLHWRARARAIWSTLTELGVYSGDGQGPVRLDEVRQAVDFLISEGLVTGGDL